MGKSTKWRILSVNMLLKRSVCKGSWPKVEKVRLAEGATCELPGVGGEASEGWSPKSRESGPSSGKD